MKDDQGGGLTYGWGGFLGLLDVLNNVVRDTWCSRGPRRALVARVLEPGLRL